MAIIQSCFGRLVNHSAVIVGMVAIFVSADSQARMHWRFDGLSAAQSVMIPTVQFNIGPKMELGPTYSKYLSGSGLVASGYGIRYDWAPANIFASSLTLGAEMQMISNATVSVTLFSGNVDYQWFINTHLNVAFGFKAIYTKFGSSSSVAIPAGFSPGFETVIGFVF